MAIRADMDALPVKEEVDLPFASKVVTTYDGKETGVMHACGHDAHMAILMATAEVLTSIREELPGSVKFIFQPAEEGAFEEDIWGAELMIREGVLIDPAPEVIFGLHVMPGPAGTIAYNEEALMASVDNFKIVVQGSGTHGAMPWFGNDPIVVASTIVVNLQSIVSRNVDLTEGAAVVTVGSIHGGNRNNIISDEVELLGTIRTHNDVTRELVHRRVREIVENTAASFGAGAQVELDILYPVVVNHEDICFMMQPALEQAAGKDNVSIMNPIMAAEDFSFFLNEIPGMFFFLGVAPEGMDPHEVEPNHSPRFQINESALKTGVRAFSYMVLEYSKNKKLAMH
jgi:amidohydrolase